MRVHAGRRTHVAPVVSVAVGAAALAALFDIGSISGAGWIAGLVYLATCDALLTRGLRRSGTGRFGAANAVTLTRSTLVAIVTALVVTSLYSPVPSALIVGVAAPALALDAVDGWVARRTGTASELGARFDMEVDAFLILVLSVGAAPQVGWWVLSLGLMRYAFVAAGWAWPWLRATVPPRSWRKVVAAVAGIALTIAVSGWFAPWVDDAVTLLALALLLESFGRDVVWLAAERRREVTSGSARMPVRSGS